MKTWSAVSRRFRREIEERITRPGEALFRCAWLYTLNKTSHKSVIGESAAPVVSLTSYGTRVNTAYLTIESIARGGTKPSRLILWLNEAELVETPSKELQRLKRRGLEVFLTRNYGPHTKYFPYILSQTTYKTPLVTADDDIIYPSHWLSELSQSYESSPEYVHCFRAHHIGVTNGNLDPYEYWLPCLSTAPSHLTFATGVSGVLYPPMMLRAIQGHGEGFNPGLLPNDDIWLHWIALTHKIKVRQIKTRPMHFSSLSSTQRVRLSRSNVSSGRNNLLLKQAYSAEDISVMTDAGKNSPALNEDREPQSTQAGQIRRTHARRTK